MAGDEEVTGPPEGPGAGSTRSRLAWATAALSAARSGPGEAAQATAFLLDHVERLEAMLRHTLDMIVVLDENGRILFANGAAGALTGHGEEVSGTNATDFIHPEDLERASADFDACLARPGSTAGAELRIRHADGSWHFVDVHAENCLLDELGGAAVVVSMRDICDRREAEASLRRANDAMRDFVAVASHDLRSPVAVISGLSAALVSDWDRLDDPGRRELARVVSAAAERMGRLVENLLVISKLEAGVPGRTRAVDLAAAVEAALEASGIPHVSSRVPEGTMVLVDPDHLERILANYLHNAAHHGAPPVTVTSRTADGLVELRVVDRGPGVPEEFRARLFQRFARAEPSSGRGTGLGLAIVRDLARAAGGEAWYEPAAPHGACFGLTLPAGGRPEDGPPAQDGLRR